MAREKTDFRDNLEMVLQKFGNVQLIPLKTAAEFCGVDIRCLKRSDTFPIKKIGGRYYVPLVSLARWLS